MQECKTQTRNKDEQDLEVILNKRPSSTPQEAEEDRRKVDSLWKERMRWQDDNPDSASSYFAEEIEDADKQYKTKLEDFFLEDKGKIAGFLIRIGLATGFIDPVKQLRSCGRKLDKEKTTYRRLDNKIRIELKRTAKEKLVIEKRLAQTYEFDLKSEQVIENERAEIIRMKGEIDNLKQGSYSPALIEGLNKRMEKNKTRIRACEEYIQDLERKRLDNVLDEKYLRNALKETKEKYSSLDAESKEILNRLYSNKQQVIPVRSATKIAERKRQSLEVSAKTSVIDRNAKKLAEIVKGNIYRREAISLKEAYKPEDDNIADVYDEVRTRREEAFAVFEKSKAEALGEMKQRRLAHYDAGY